ncbi:MAG TPA: DUF1592 domain-containing protein, partial [Polyangiaceae bacterium LLY-WYZ-15_(1-7)]|nr:DUF1592 domain-containing protein [Polyangiaceae bacterium LLY-WYZ-15_(1-7)]
PTEPEAPENPRPPGVPVPGSDDCRPPPARLWQLDPRQLASTLEQIAPDVAPAGLAARFGRTMTLGAPFSSRPDIQNASTPFLAELVDVARAMAVGMVATGEGLPPCAADGAADDACADEVVDRLTRSAWRRPATPEERDALRAAHQAARAEHGDAGALRVLAQRILSAPATLFRSELGRLDPESGAAELSDHELADWLAYTLTDAPPDAELAAAADAGTLRERAALEAQVRRLLAREPAAAEVADLDGRSPARLHGLLRFFHEWLELDRIKDAPIAELRRAAPEGHPVRDRSPESLGRWLAQEPILFARQVLWEDDARLETLLGADWTVYGRTPADGEEEFDTFNTLRDYYGGEPRPAVETGPTADGRRGLLMLGGFLVAHHSTTHRGRWIREQLFCQPVPDPPPSVDNNLAGVQDRFEEEAGEPLSPREVRARHLGDPVCAGCHAQTDPLGYPFDAFDSLGLPRETWPGGFSIDTAGAIEGTASTDGAVPDAPTLAERLAASADVRACFVRRLFTFVHGRAPEAGDACVLTDLEARFEASDGDVRELLVHMLAHDSNRTRTPQWDE